MKQYFIILLATLLFAISAYCGSKEITPGIKPVNDAVQAINDSIKNNEYSVIDIKETSISEISGPSLKMYYIDSRLVLVLATADHESWSNEFRFYFYPNGKPMKYIKETKDRPDNPAKNAIIYDQKGVIVWKNCDSPAMPPNDLHSLFLAIQTKRTDLSKY